MTIYAKGIVAVITAGLLAIQAALIDGWANPGDDVTVGLAVLGAIAVLLTPNAAAHDRGDIPAP